MQPELAELRDQQQRDRRQLLLYSARLDEQVRKTAELTRRIAELTEMIETTKAANRRELEELQSRHATEMAGNRRELEELQSCHAAEMAGNRRELEELQSRYAAEIAELAAWRDTMMRSRVYRLMLLYGRLYQVPVLGHLLRFLRRTAGAVYAGLKSFRQR